MKTRLALTEVILRKERVPCQRCGIWNKKPLYGGLPFVYKCIQCGFVYTSPRLKSDVLKDFYSREYFENHASSEMGYDNYVSDQDLVRKTFRKRLLKIQQNWLASKGRVLDVGCATGFFLENAKEMGWGVEGIEISDYCCEYASREFDIPVHNGIFQDVSVPDNFYDLVTMWDYLEHSPAAFDDIKKAYRTLRPGGILALTTPDVESFPAQLFKARWMGFKEHEHLFYFGAKNLKEILRESGFKIRLCTHAGKYVSLDFFIHRLALYADLTARILKKSVCRTPLSKLRFYCNPFDILHLVAQK